MKVPTGQAPLATAIPRCCVLPAFSVDSSVGLYAYLLIFSFESTASSKLTEIS